MKQLDVGETNFSTLEDDEICKAETRNHGDGHFSNAHKRNLETSPETAVCAVGMLIIGSQHEARGMESDKSGIGF